MNYGNNKTKDIIIILILLLLLLAIIINRTYLIDNFSAVRKPGF